ncbi:MAG: enoyl-CoA hydratase/isomerase family protein [Pirellulales bacterium]
MIAMSGPLVKVQVHGAAGTILLNRPEKRNALSRAMLTEVSQALDDLHLERRARAVVIVGAGSSFCAGMDLAEMQATSQADDPHAQWQADATQYRDLIEQMWRYPKPIIAAVNGPAMAGGMGLVLASDLAIAARSASFGLPEPLRGIVAGMVSPLLMFRLGGAHAARLLLTAQPIDAAEALRIGLVSELVGEDQIWARAAQLAEQIARCAPEAVQLSKRMLNETIGESLPMLLSAGAAASATARTTEAAAEGLAAFREKREPKWP